MKRRKFVFTVAACAVLASCTAWGIMNEVRGFRAPSGGAKEAVEGFLWLEAESFADYGNVGKAGHCWVSDPAQNLPQTLTLEFGRPVAAREVRLTFDPDLNPLHPRGNPLPPTLVKAYVVEVFDGRDWMPMATEARNTVRHRIHKFQSRTVTAVRIRIDATWGDPSARVFEVRVY